MFQDSTSPPTPSSPPTPMGTASLRESLIYQNWCNFTHCGWGQTHVYKFMYIVKNQGGWGQRLFSQCVKTSILVYEGFPKAFIQKCEISLSSRNFPGCFNIMLHIVIFDLTELHRGETPDRSRTPDQSAPPGTICTPSTSPSTSSTSPTSTFQGLYTQLH